MSNFCWHLFPDIFFRKTGFSFDILEELYCLKSVVAIKALFEIEHKQEYLYEQLHHEILTKDNSSVLPLTNKRILKQIERAKRLRERVFTPLQPEQSTAITCLIIQWNELIEQSRTAYAQARVIFDTELRQARQKFRQIISDERFQEAIFLNSPVMYKEGLLPFLHPEIATTQINSKYRKRERTLMLYLQRFCAKNDTASFFGPMNYGRFQPKMDENIHYRILDDKYPPKRRVLLSYWAAEALMKTMTRDPHLLVENKPICSALIVLKENTIFLPSLDQEVPLDILSITILRLANAQTTLLTISQMLEIPLAILVERVQLLAACQLLELRLPLDRYAVDLLKAVEASINDFTPSEAKTRWKEIIARFRGYLQAFESAQLHERLQLLPVLEQLFTEVVGLEAHRGQGQLFSDRLIFYEETSGDVIDFAVGGNLYQDLVTQLRTPLDILASCALVEHHEQQKRGWQQLQAILPHTKNPSYLLNLYLQARAINSAESGGRPAWGAMWQEVWDSLLATHYSQTASFSETEIDGTILESLEEQRLLAGPDIMIAAQDYDSILRGDYKIVLSEVHPLLLPTHKDLSLFYPNLPQALEQARILLDHLIYPQQELIFASRRVSKADMWPVGHPIIYPQWVHNDVDTCPIPIADIKVDISITQTPVFRVPYLDEPCSFALPLVIDEPFEPFLMCFTRPQIWMRPVIKARHTPRIEIGNVVFQRERWDLGIDDLPKLPSLADDFDTFLSLWRWKQAWNMPDQLFLKPKTDKVTKPILVDFLSPLSCLSALKVSGRSQGGTFTEMFPGPDQLWLQHNGQRYTCELRFTAFRMPETFHLEKATHLFQSRQSMSEQEIISQQLKMRIADYIEKGASFDEETLGQVAYHLRFVQEEVRPLTTEE